MENDTNSPAAKTTLAADVCQECRFAGAIKLGNDGQTHIERRGRELLQEPSIKAGTRSGSSYGSAKKGNKIRRLIHASATRRGRSRRTFDVPFACDRYLTGPILRCDIFEHLIRNCAAGAGRPLVRHSHSVAAGGAHGYRPSRLARRRPFLKAVVTQFLFVEAPR